MVRAAANTAVVRAAAATAVMGPRAATAVVMAAGEAELDFPRSRMRCHTLLHCDPMAEQVQEALEFAVRRSFALSIALSALVDRRY